MPTLRETLERRAVQIGWDVDDLMDAPRDALRALLPQIADNELYRFVEGLTGIIPLRSDDLR